MYNVSDDFGHNLVCDLWNNDTSWSLKDTHNILAGQEDLFEYNFTSDGVYEWNVECKDGQDNSASYFENWTIEINTSAVDNTGPTVTLLIPDQYESVDSNYVDFTFNASDDLSPSLDCTLLINDVEGNSFGGDVIDLVNGQTYTFENKYLDDGVYQWNTQCADGVNNTAMAPINNTFCVGIGCIDVTIELDDRSEEHTSELQSHSFISYAVFCLNKKTSLFFFFNSFFFFFLPL